MKKTFDSVNNNIVGNVDESPEVRKMSSSMIEELEGLRKENDFQRQMLKEIEMINMKIKD